MDDSGSPDYPQALDVARLIQPLATIGDLPIASPFKALGGIGCPQPDTAVM